MDYKNYQKSRDAAWKLLIDCRIGSLPIELNSICSCLDVKVLSYVDGWDMIERYHLCNHSKNTDGFLLMLHQQPIIFYDSNRIPSRIRFTVAHEIGHLVLGHVTSGQVTAVNREPSPVDKPHETAANQFAARLLAPACVLWGLQLHTPQQISNQCNISIVAAQFRAERMKTLYARNKFLTSPLEKQVFDLFKDFINNAV